MSTIFVTPRMRLRHYTHDDLDELAAMFADEEHMRFYPRPKSRDEALQWIDWNLGLYQQHGFGLWVMESRAAKEFLGNCGLTPQTVEGVTDIELGWHTKRSHWNQGLATEAARACLERAFSDFGLERVISIIRPENIASVRVAENIGMKPEKTASHGGYPHVVYAIGIPDLRPSYRFHHSFRLPTACAVEVTAPSARTRPPFAPAEALTHWVASSLKDLGRGSFDARVSSSALRDSLPVGDECLATGQFP